jgi:uncharacterized membrane protein
MKISQPTAVSVSQGIFAFLGFCDAAIVYISKIRYGEVPCALGYSGCTSVVTGPYSHIGPIDVTLLGIAGYVVILLLSIFRCTAGNRKVEIGSAWLIFAFSLFGFCFSWYLQWITKYVMHDFCIDCRISAILMSLIFIVSLADRWILRSKEPLSAIFINLNQTNEH